MVKYGNERKDCILKRISSFDFGVATVPTVPGYLKVERVYTSPKYLWIIKDLI